MDPEDCRSYTVLTYADGQVGQREDPVAVEHALAVYLDGALFLSLLCTPRALPELVVGFLHAEGVIATVDDMARLQIDAQGATAQVTLRRDRRQGSEQTFTVTTAGGLGGRTLQPEVDAASVADAACERASRRLDPARLCRLMETFEVRSELFLRTGGAHSCALSDGEAVLLFEDDIGRHNALDKIVGHTLLQSMAVEDKVIVTSGRVSSEIVAKVFRRGIDVIVSRSAPTSRAIDLARTNGMTLIGFVRGRSLNVYANFSCLKGV